MQRTTSPSHRRHSGMAAAVLALGALAIPSLWADEVPAKYRPAIKKGLDWLVKQQHADGSWPAQADEHTPAFTAFAGLALLMEGSSPSKGAYADSLKRAADWYVQNGRRADGGLLGKRPSGQSASGYMFGHGYGMLFLASVYASEDNRPGGKELKDLLHRARRKEYRQVLERAVQFTVKAQSSTGGWSYVSRADGHDSDEGTCTLCQIQALRAVQLAGIDVPRATLDKALAYLEKNTSQRGGLCYMTGSSSERTGLTAAAVACAFKPGDYQSDLAKKWLKFVEQTMLAGGRFGAQAGYAEYNQLHAAQVMHGLGETGHREVFGKDREVKWSAYRQMCFDQLVGAQQRDGSWPAAGRGLGPIFATGVNLIVLQLDNEAVPIFRTKKRP